MHRCRKDCLALLNTAQAGLAAATAASKKLARIWGMIGSTLDGDLSALADAATLIWLPAHLGFSAVGQRVLSNGKIFTMLDWRANRLVDALAKAFANDMAAPNSLTTVVLSARVAQKHSLALLGCVTHMANNHTVQVTRDDGTTTNVTKRDVTEPPKLVRGQKEKQCGDPVVTPTAGRTLVRTPALWRRERL